PTVAAAVAQTGTGSQHRPGLVSGSSDVSIVDLRPSAPAAVARSASSPPSDGDTANELGRTLHRNDELDGSPPTHPDVVAYQLAAPAGAPSKLGTVGSYVSFRVKS